jgi:colanic acid/amylovoran biosynthesis glycosyltransferase
LLLARLLIISSAPAAHRGDNVRLDVKFVGGMCRYSDLWEGPVSCLLGFGQEAFPFAQDYAPEDLPFRIEALPVGRPIRAEDIRDHDVILCDGDSHAFLHLPDLCRAEGKTLVFVIENIPETRRRITMFDSSRSMPRKLRSILWQFKQEGRRREAFARADGLQANGYPAFKLYAPLNRQAMMYLDNRVGEGMLATEQEMTERERRLRSGASLRLLHSGRLEQLKGSLDLVRVASALRSLGIDFTLDIFGTGSLEGEIRRGIVTEGLGEVMRLHGPVDFETGLVPFARRNADIYLSCHLQSDPSCTYVESMGCGLAVVGYANKMWSALCAASGAGATAVMGDVDRLAACLAQASANRDQLAAWCRAGWSFASDNSFEREFRRRVDHLRNLER